MAGDTLRGIGKKAIAEALEAAAAAEHATEPNGTAPAPVAALADDAQGRPERSLDELPSERTGAVDPGDAAVAAVDSAITAANHTDNHALAGMAITTATTLVQEAPVQEAPAPNPGTATLPGTSTSASAPAAASINTAVTMVDDAAPLGSSTSTPRSGPNRVSFGTMIGHEVHAMQARIADSDVNVRGTAHGHDVHHLPGHSAAMGGVEPDGAPAAAAAPSNHPASHAEPAIGLAEYLSPKRDSQNEFFSGDHSFFDTAPVNDEYEPENPRGRLYTRLAVSGAVVAVVAVVVVAWVNSHGASEEPPVEVKSQPAVTAPVRTAVAVPAPARPAPPPAPAQEPPTSTIPSSMPERIAVTTPPPHPAKAAPSLAPPAPAPATRPAIAAVAKPAAVAVSAAPAPKPAPAAAPPAPKPAPIAAAAAPKPTPAAAPVPKAAAPVAAAPAPVRELRTPPPAPPQKKPTAVAAAAPHPAAAPAPHAATPAPAPAPATRPAPTVAKAPQSAPSHPVAKSTPARASKAPPRGKQKYDPDGTLPLSFE